MNCINNFRLGESWLISTFCRYTKWTPGKPTIFASFIWSWNYTIRYNIEFIVMYNFSNSNCVFKLNGRPAVVMKTKIYIPYRSVRNGNAENPIAFLWNAHKIHDTPQCVTSHHSSNIAQSERCGTEAACPHVAVHTQQMESLAIVPIITAVNSLLPSVVTELQKPKFVLLKSISQSLYCYQLLTIGCRRKHFKFLYIITNSAKIYT